MAKIIAKGSAWGFHVNLYALVSPTWLERVLILTHSIHAGERERSVKDGYSAHLARSRKLSNVTLWRDNRDEVIHMFDLFISPCGGLLIYDEIQLRLATSGVEFVPFLCRVLLQMH